jgi:hypothetical protein
MKALSKLKRNDVIRAVALVTVVAFPLIAYAQLGSVAKVVTLTVAAAPAAAEAVTPAKVSADACANQHWPFFSAECLRGSTQPIKPRLVSMNMEDSPAPQPAAKLAATSPSRHVVRAVNAVQGDAPVAKSRKPLKPRVAHVRARKPLNLSYASNAGAAPGWTPGWQATQ